MQSPTRYCTGGAAARDATQMLNMPGRWCLYGVLGQMSHEFDAGGPLDAPEALPAGCMDSTSTRSGPWHLNDGRGRAVPAVTIVQRDT